MNYHKLFKIAISTSIKQTTIYPFHTLTTFINVFLNIFVNIFFWIVITSCFGEIGFYSIEEILVLNMFALLADCFGGFFFGFRDMPYEISYGNYDKYLLMPQRDTLILLLEKVPVIYMLQQFVVAFVGLIVLRFYYKLTFNFINLIMSLFSLLVGAIIINLLYGILTFFTFVIERLDGLRELIFSLQLTKNYPLKIFPKFIQIILTYVIPVSFVSYYPTMIFFNKIEHFDIIYFEMAMLVVVCVFYEITHKLVLDKYNSNGG